MSAEYFSVLRQQMLAEIAAETIYVSARLGKAALDPRVDGSDADEGMS